MTVVAVEYGAIDSEVLARFAVICMSGTYGRNCCAKKQ
jgi:hypothetical protein